MRNKMKKWKMTIGKIKGVVRKKKKENHYLNLNLKNNFINFKKLKL